MNERKNHYFDKFNMKLFHSRIHRLDKISQGRQMILESTKLGNIKRTYHIIVLDKDNIPIIWGKKEFHSFNKAEKTYDKLLKEAR